MNFSSLRPFMVRFGIITAVAFVFALAFNEITFRMQKEPTDRSPTTFKVVIPRGTAERVEAGEEVSLLPEEITFVIGDVLEVINEDTVSHQLGPIWTPPGATGKLVMEQATRGAYTCSFQSNQYLGFDVRPAVTVSTRVTALFLTVPTLAVLIFLYSLAWRPIKVSQRA